MTDSNEPRLPTQYTRPDLGWAEELLGESLGPLPDQTHEMQSGLSVTADPSVIPHGEYCYDSEAEGHVPCPHYRHTEHGTFRCNYLGYEAIENGSGDATIFDKNCPFRN